MSHLEPWDCKICHQRTLSLLLFKTKKSNGSVLGWKRKISCIWGSWSPRRQANHLQITCCPAHIITLSNLFLTKDRNLLKNPLAWLKCPLHRPWVKGCKYCSPQENAICTLRALRWTAWWFLSTAISHPQLFYPLSNRLKLWLLQGAVFHLQLGIQFPLVKFNLEIISDNNRGIRNSWSGRNLGRNCPSLARSTEEGYSRWTAMEGILAEMNNGAQ